MSRRLCDVFIGNSSSHVRRTEVIRLRTETLSGLPSGFLFSCHGRISLPRMDVSSAEASGAPPVTPDQMQGIDGDSQTKRRKVRKGTRSCWECRRRKMKCTFGLSADTACISCQRRGAKCVDQQFPEQISAPLDRSLQMGDRVVRVEGLIEQLLEKVSSNSDPCCGCTTAQDIENGEYSRGNLSPVFARPVLVEQHSSYESLNVREQHSKAS